MRQSLIALAALLAVAIAVPCPFLDAQDEAGRQAARRALADRGGAVMHNDPAKRQLVSTILAGASSAGAEATAASSDATMPTSTVAATGSEPGTPTSSSSAASASSSTDSALGPLGVLGPVPDLLQGLVGGLAENVNPDNLRPDAAHPFQSPGPTDQRGPCPGLNALANHGYLPRNGIVQLGNVIEVLADVFNFEPDLSGLLGVVAVLFSGNLETETWSIGGEDDRTYSASGIGSKDAGRQFGLDAHSRCEGDISPTREDFFTNNGDNHSGSPRKFARFTELAKSNGNSYNLDAVNALYGQNAQESIAGNPNLYFQGYTPIVILGAYPFIPAFMSNGTYGAGGVSNYDSIGSIMGYQANEDGSFCYVPERFPENWRAWYRRDTPYGIANGLVPGLVPTCHADLSGPVLPNPLGALLQNPAQATDIGCAIYQGITSGIPDSLAGSTNERISAAVSYAQSKLLSGFPSLYACPSNSDYNSTAPPTNTALQATGLGGEQAYGTCGA